MTAALQHITVVDLTRPLAGPFCTMRLRDRDVDGITIAEPDWGDETRAWPPLWDGERTQRIEASVVAPSRPTRPPNIWSPTRPRGTVAAIPPNGFYLIAKKDVLASRSSASIVLRISYFRRNRHFLATFERITAPFRVIFVTNCQGQMQKRKLE
jgi:hypothetical protein